MSTRSILSIAAKTVLAVTLLAAVYAGLGFYIVPALLKSKLPEMIQQQTGRKAAVNALEFDPFALQFKLQGFQMQEQDGSPFVSFETFYVSMDARQSLRQRALVLDKVVLGKPFVKIARQKNGTFNFTDLIKPKDPAKQEDGKMIPVNIGKLSISEGKLAWADAQNPQPVAETITPVNLELENFTTQAGGTFNLALSLALQSGGELHWQGSTGINPLTSEGHIKLAKFKLGAIQKLALAELPFEVKGEPELDAAYKVTYADNKLNIDIQQSKLNLRDFQFSAKEPGKLTLKIPSATLDAGYKLSYADNKLNLGIPQGKLALRDIQFLAKQSVNIPVITLETGLTVSHIDQRLNVAATQGKLDIQGFQLSEAGQDAILIKIPAVSGRGIGFDLNDRAVTIDSVAANDAELQAWLNADGSFNYLTLFAGESTEVNPADNMANDKAAAAQNTPWDIKINSVTLANSELAFEDRTLKKPLLMTLAPIDLKLKNFTNQSGVRLPVELSAGVNKTGSIKLAGEAVVEPLSAKLAVTVKDIELEKFQPYVDKFVRVDIIDGQLAVEGNATVAKSASGQFDVKFKGNTGIASLLTRDQLQNKDFIKWEKLSLKNLDADVLANRYSADALVIHQPYARVVINKDKTINFSDILHADVDKNPRPAVKKQTAESSERQKLHFKLGSVQVIDGSSYFSDLSLILPFKADIKSLDGGASGISSEPQSMVKVSLKGNAYELSPVDIKAEVSPYRGDFHVIMSFKGMPMPLVSPYMVQFAGYKVEKGKLSLDLIYNVTKGQLTAANNILIDQFELGEKVENPNAVSLPLELAVALLKDGDGKIKIDVPITGSLEDPQFSLRALIADALVNAISKVVTAPFRAIASLIGSKEDLSSVTFAAGRADLAEPEKIKLRHLSKALNERPMLTLEIKGAAFEEQDWPALTDDALYDQLKRIRADEINKQGGKKIRSEYVELSDADYKRLLAELFIEKFPALAEKSLLGTPRLKNPKGGDFYAVAKKQLEGIIKPEEMRLKHLAADRAQSIAKYVVQQGGVSNDRVYILDVAIDPERQNKEIVAGLSLKTR